MKPKILVLDDDSVMLLLISEILSEGGFDVMTVKNGTELWEAASATPIDLYILDLVLQDESGLDIARALRSQSNAGIIIVSAKRGETDRVLGLELGADDYITKPFSPVELLARVRSVLRRAHGQSHSEHNQTDATRKVVRFFGYTLDLSAYHLIDDTNTEIHLTSAEFELLKALVADAGQVLSRDHLLDAIHGRVWVGDNRSVDGLVSRLRRKIKVPSGAPELIKTVRGTGYLFTANLVGR